KKDESWTSCGVRYNDFDRDDFLQSDEFIFAVDQSQSLVLNGLREDYEASINKYNEMVENKDDHNEYEIENALAEKNLHAQTLLSAVNLTKDAEILHFQSVEEEDWLDYDGSRTLAYTEGDGFLGYLIEASNYDPNIGQTALNYNDNIRNDLKSIQPQLQESVKYHALRAELETEKELFDKRNRWGIKKYDNLFLTLRAKTGLNLYKREIAKLNNQLQIAHLKYMFDPTDLRRYHEFQQKLITINKEYASLREKHLNPYRHEKLFDQRGSLFEDRNSILNGKMGEMREAIRKDVVYL
ncbi:MAG: hypothetical protein GY821_17675, partial [Gammaproteobacteria bacterium]|nr:hypothetical protein [Gammaproteobacteria bacterium]